MNNYAILATILCNLSIVNYNSNNSNNNQKESILNTPSVLLSNQDKDENNHFLFSANNNLFYYGKAIKPTQKKRVGRKEIVELAEYIKSHEGLSLNPMYCEGNKLSIGYGHVILKKENWMRNGITQEDAENILYEDLDKVEKAVEELLNKDSIELSSSQKIAIIHFVYSLGIGNFKKSSLYKTIKVKTKRGEKLSEEDKQLFYMWNVIRTKKGIKKSNYLLKMRQWEVNKFYEN